MTRNVLHLGVSKVTVELHARPCSIIIMIQPCGMGMRALATVGLPGLSRLCWDLQSQRGAEITSWIIEQLYPPVNDAGNC